MEGERLLLLASARTAKESLAHHAAVTVPVPPPRPAVVLNAAQLDSHSA
jgi:hypothetical protein